MIGSPEQHIFLVNSFQIYLDFAREDVKRMQGVGRTCKLLLWTGGDECIGVL